MLIVCLDRDYVQLRINIVNMGVYSFLSYVTLTKQSYYFTA